MEAWLERLYARLGRRYVPALVGAMVLGGVAHGRLDRRRRCAGIWTPASAPSLRVFAVMGAQMLASMGVGLFIARDDLRTLAAWTRAGRAGRAAPPTPGWRPCASRRA